LIVHYCDRCKSVLTGWPTNENKIYRKGISNDSLELCDKCQRNFIDLVDRFKKGTVR